MFRTRKLDRKNVKPLYPYTEWSDKAILKWLIMVAKFDVTKPYTKHTNSDGTETFTQDQGPPAMRIFRSP